MIFLAQHYNLLRNPNEFIEESEWILWGIWGNTLRNLSEFIEVSEGIHWEIQVNSLRNPSEFIEEFEWIVDFNWICLVQMHLLNTFKIVRLQNQWFFSVIKGEWQVMPKWHPQEGSRVIKIIDRRFLDHLQIVLDTN